VALRGGPRIGLAPRPLTPSQPYPPDGFTDVTARLVARHLAPAPGQSIVVDDRSGASGALNVAAAARTVLDGCALALTITAHAVTPSLYTRRPYDAATTWRHVWLAGTAALLAAVPAATPFADIKELIVPARSHPGPITFGSSGLDSAAH